MPIVSPYSSGNSIVVTLSESVRSEAEIDTEDDLRVTAEPGKIVLEAVEQVPVHRAEGGDA